MEYKVCSKCGESKPIELFGRCNVCKNAIASMLQSGIKIIEIK